MTTARPLRIVRAVWRGASLVLLVAMVTIAGVVALGAGLGYRPIVILSGSMGDAAPPGSLIIAKPEREVVVGDIIVMRGPDRPTVTHRVVALESAEGGGLEAVTRGDANPDIDPVNYPLASRELVARWVVDDAGEWFLTVRRRTIALAITAGLLLGVVAMALRRIWAPQPQVWSSDRTAAAVTESGPGADGQAAPGAAPGRRRIAFATGFGMFAASVGVVYAVFAGTAAVNANNFSALECYDSRLGAVHRGHHTSDSDGIDTVTIPAVDPTSSMLLFSASSNSSEPADSIISAVLAGPTTIEFTRNTDAGSPPHIDIEWSVVEFACGVTVQRGTATGTGTASLDVAISPIDTTASFVLTSSVPAADDSVYSGGDQFTSELLDADTVRITSATTIAVGRPITWQVVTFDNGTDIVVETVETTLGPGQGTTTTSLARAVEPSATMVLTSSRSANAGPDLGDRMPRVELADSSTIAVSRALTSGSVTVVTQVVEFRDGTTVTTGTTAMGVGEAMTSASLIPVTPARSTPLATVQFPSGASGGEAPATGSAVPGEGATRLLLASPSVLELRRAASDTAATIGWQVITWGGPPWADLTAPFRRRVAVTAGSVTAPMNYTTAVTIDHADMVGNGFSRSDGSDLRLWRHDGTGWSELDRILDDSSSFDSSTTTLRFRTQEQIGASEAASYWLYFGDTTPDPVLDDPANVWLVTEGFDTGTLGAFEDRTGGTGWYSAATWSHRIPLTIPAGIVTSDVADAIVPVRLSSATLASHAQADGSDLRFTAADGTTPLDHEIESFESATGTLTAWVRVPNITAASPTQFFLYTGADDAPAQSDPRSTLAGLLAVWHMAADIDGGHAGLDDSGPRQLDGIALADVAELATAAGPAVALDGSLDRLEAPPLRLPDGGFTVAAWARADTLTGERVLVTQGDPAAGGAFELRLDASGPPTVVAALRTSTGVVEATGGAPTVATWHSIVATWDTTTLRLYLDGVEVAASSATDILVDGPRPLTIGADPSGSSALAGAIGEVWVDDSAWNLARIGLFHSALDDPNGTVTVSTEGAGSWFPQGSWAVRRPVGIDKALASVTLTDFPLLVHVTDAALAARAAADGRDFVFTAANGTTRLDHQIEAWSPGTGELIAWVRVPMIDAAADTTIYLYLDNTSAVDQQDVAGTWGAEMSLVITD